MSIISGGIVEITGDRQAGKTQRLVDAAFLDASGRGRRVLFVTCHREVCDALDRLLSWGGYERAVRANGQQRVTYASGGEVVFRSTRQGGRGHVVDTLIVDEVPVGATTTSADLLACLNGRPDPRVYVARQAL